MHICRASSLLGPSRSPVHSPHTQATEELLSFSIVLGVGDGGWCVVVVVVVAGAGAATGQIRAVACVHLVLGLAAATFALCVTSLHPQLKQQGAACAATEDNAVAMRTHGLLLLLSAGTQAAAAAVAVFAPVSWRPSPWIYAAFAHAVSVLTYFHFINAFVAVAVGSYPVHLQADSAEFIAQYVLLIVPLRVFFGIGVRALVDP